MSEKLSDKVAIVTGAASGIGRAVALRLGSQDASVVVNDINLEQANKVADEIKALNGKAVAIKADVTKSGEVNQMVETTMGYFGKIDILVNNAGAVAPTAFFHEYTEEGWDFLINVNLKSVFNCTRAVIEHMIQRKSGKIVNIASAAGIIGAAGAIAYSTAKAGVIGFTKTLAKEVTSYGISVNCVSPGPIATPLFLAHPDYVERVKKNMYLDRIGKPEEIANVVAFLVSDEGSFIIGQNIPVDGGRTLGW